MINVSSSSQTSAGRIKRSRNQQSVQTHKNAQNQQQPQDTVVLSKKATETNDAAQGDSDHDGH